MENPAVAMIAEYMVEFGVKEIKLDNNGRLLYISYLSSQKENKMPEISNEPDYDPFADPTEFDAEADPYDDPDLWPDGRKPTFKAL